MKKILGIFAVLLILAGGIGAYLIYTHVFQPNVELGNKEFTYLYIPTGADLQTVVDSLEAMEVLRNADAFRVVAERKNYPAHLHPGRYRITDGLSNNELVNLLRSGEQEPLNFTFTNLRTKEDVAQLAGKTLELHEDSLLSLIHNPSFLADTYGMDSISVATLFIPNTYEFMWDTDSREFLDRMAEEYKRFWTPERKAKAKELGLSQTEVATLASIVQQETYRDRDKPRIAGVYLNRLRIGMPLQADPTLKFALREFDIRRVLNKDKEVESPYNTYKYRGLPPGPIDLPTPTTIDAVLNAEDHKYLYFVAKPDFSGYSAFSHTYSEHLRKARAYQRALNEREILR